ECVGGMAIRRLVNDHRMASIAGLLQRPSVSGWQAQCLGIGSWTLQFPRSGFLWSTDDRFGHERTRVGFRCFEYLLAILSDYFADWDGRRRVWLGFGQLLSLSLGAGERRDSSPVAVALSTHRSLACRNDSSVRSKGGPQSLCNGLQLLSESLRFDRSIEVCLSHHHRRIDLNCLSTGALVGVVGYEGRWHASILYLQPGG